MNRNDKEFERIQILKRIEEAKKDKYCAKQQMAQAEMQIGEYDLQLLNLDDEKLEEINDEKPKTVRTYGRSRIEGMPIITDVCRDGTLILETGRTARGYDMFDLLDLERKIPQIEKYPSMKSLARSSRTSETTCAKLCAGIELRMYDHLFDKWQYFQLKYDETGQLIS